MALETYDRVTAEWAVLAWVQERAQALNVAIAAATHFGLPLAVHVERDQRVVVGSPDAAVQRELTPPPTNEATP